MTRPEESYTSPFSARYVSEEMSHLFSAQFKITTFRRLWVSLAKGQSQLGLPIRKDQIAELEKHIDTIDFAAAKNYEKKFRHDVMAHIHAFGDQCPSAKPILHLGATSTYVTDNADLIQIKAALTLLFNKLLHIIGLLSSFAKKHAQDPCLSYTHFQSAQPTTIGKRSCLWLQDLLFDASEWERLLDTLPFLGLKGATGTQASFLALFDGDAHKVDQLEQKIAHDFGFTKVLPIAGQTYTRKIDIHLLNALSSFAATCHKLATDIRLLAHDGEITEQFLDTQVGSSAMPYKRNPIYSERICGLSRFVISLSQNPLYTAATQWLERSLDDSSNRRLSIPEAFLGADALLNLLAHLFSHLTAHPKTSLKRLEEKLPQLILENLLMQAVKKGGDRQQLHEHLRRLCLEAEQQPLSFLRKELEKEPFHLKKQEIENLLDTQNLIGRAPEQVRIFLDREVKEFLEKHPHIQVRFPPVEM